MYEQDDNMMNMSNHNQYIYMYEQDGNMMNMSNHNQYIYTCMNKMVI